MLSEDIDILIKKLERFKNIVKWAEREPNPELYSDGEKSVNKIYECREILYDEIDVLSIDLRKFADYLDSKL